MGTFLHNITESIDPVPGPVPVQRQYTIKAPLYKAKANAKFFL